MLSPRIRVAASLIGVFGFTHLDQTGHYFAHLHRAPPL